MQTHWDWVRSSDAYFDASGARLLLSLLSHSLRGCPRANLLGLGAIIGCIFRHLGSLAITPLNESLFKGVPDSKSTWCGRLKPERAKSLSRQPVCVYISVLVFVCVRVYIYIYVHCVYVCLCVRAYTYIYTYAIPERAKSSLSHTRTQTHSHAPPAERWGAGVEYHFQEI